MSRLLGIPLGWIMYGIYMFCKSYGLSLIIFALLTKLILLPLNMKSQRSSAKMRALAPKMEKIKKSFANNPQRMQQEQMKLQAEEGVSPMAGCLPMLIQFPILFGIVDVVYKPLTHILKMDSKMLEAAGKVLEEIKKAEGISGKTVGRYEELEILKYASNPDYISKFSEKLGSGFIEKISEFAQNNKFLGFIDLGTQPDFHPEVWTAGAIALIAIPILSGVINLITTVISQIHQKKINPSAPSMGSMNVMMYGMAIFYVWFSFSIPSGAAFYWTVSGFFGLIQMLALNAYFTQERCEKILAADKEKNKNKKPGLMQRMMEQQQAMLAESSTSSSSSSTSAREKRGDLSKSEYNAVNRQAINEARRRMAEKYGDEFIDDEK